MSQQKSAAFAAAPQTGNYELAIVTLFVMVAMVFAVAIAISISAVVVTAMIVIALAVIALAIIAVDVIFMMFHMRHVGTFYTRHVSMGVPVRVVMLVMPRIPDRLTMFFLAFLVAFMSIVGIAAIMFMLAPLRLAMLLVTLFSPHCLTMLFMTLFAPFRFAMFLAAYGFPMLFVSHRLVTFVGPAFTVALHRLMPLVPAGLMHRSVDHTPQLQSHSFISS